MRNIYKQAGFAEPHSSSTISWVGVVVGLGLGWGCGWGWLGVEVELGLKQNLK